MRHLDRLQRNPLTVFISCSRNFSSSRTHFADVTSPNEATAKAADQFFIPEPPLPPPTALESNPDLLINHLGEPTFKSLDLGSSYFPSDFILRFLEYVHVSTELPWWAVLGVATVTVRAFLLPFVISFRKKSVNFSNTMPTLKRIHERIETARLQNNLMEMTRLSNEAASFMERNKIVSVKSMLVFPFLNISIIISFLSAIRQMANYPVASLQNGGLFWFTDFTLPDTYCILPLLCMGSIYIIMEIGADMTKVSTQTNTMKYVMRAMPIVGFFFVMNMPSAVTYYFTVSNCISVLQTKALKIGKVREFFNIPAEVKHPPSMTQKKQTSFWETMSQSNQRSQMMKLVMERERLDDQRFREAGTSVIKKTIPVQQKGAPAEPREKELRKA